MKKYALSMLSLMMLFLTGMSAFASENGRAHVETTRFWDLTQGKNHAEEVKNCDYWSEGSKGRYSLAKALDNKELPSNKGGALTGLEGLYFTVGSGAVYGISQNF